MFFSHIFGCLATDALQVNNKAIRWFIIGKERLDNEINLEKVLKTLRQFRILFLQDKEKKARLATENKNYIAVDSDDLLKEAKDRRLKRIMSGDLIEQDGNQMERIWEAE